jgi:antitoxin component of RelBE/YafQ-DinJ toxin-antitoxin module
MKANKSIRFDEDQLEELERVAAERGLTLAGLVRTACEVYLLKQQLATELDAMESRLAASINRAVKESAKVGDDVQLLIALFDQLARFLFITTPEVIDKEAAAAVGNRRHAAFIAELHKAFSTRRRKSALSESLDSMEDAKNG